MTTRLAPLSTVEPADCTAPPSAGRVECGVCGKTFTQGAVVTSRQMWWSAEHQTFCKHRRLYCDHCDHLVTWLESCDAKGRLTGAVVMGPGYVKHAKAIAAFLRKHPSARGVSQA